MANPHQSTHTTQDLIARLRETIRELRSNEYTKQLEARVKRLEARCRTFAETQRKGLAGARALVTYHEATGLEPRAILEALEREADRSLRMRAPMPIFPKRSTLAQDLRPLTLGEAMDLLAEDHGNKKGEE